MCTHWTRTFYSDIAFVFWFTTDMTYTALLLEIGWTCASQFRSFTIFLFRVILGLKHDRSWDWRFGKSMMLESHTFCVEHYQNRLQRPNTCCQVSCLVDFSVSHLYYWPHFINGDFHEWLWLQELRLLSWVRKGKTVAKLNPFPSPSLTSPLSHSDYRLPQGSFSTKMIEAFPTNPLELSHKFKTY